MSDAVLENAKQKAASREYDAAEALYREYLEGHDTDAAVWAELGNVLLKQQKFYESGDAYAVAYDLEPENPKYISLLAKALAQVHEYEEAKLLFEKASQISGDLRCHIKVGDMLAYLHKYDEALVLYQLLAAKNPDEPKLQQRMVRVFEALGRFMDAENARRRELEILETIVAGNPTAKDWETYGDTTARLGLWDKAEAGFRNALAMENAPIFHMRLGAVFICIGKIDEGRAEFETALSLDPKDFSFIMLMADVLCQLKLYEDSIQYYTKALDLRAVHADAWAGIAYDLLQMGSLEDAAAFFEMAKASSAVRELPWADKLHKSEKTKALDAALKGE